MKYEYLAIKTIYQNTVYRSKIEAVFSAFMDLCPQVFVLPKSKLYECIRYGDYLPDFEIPIKLPQPNGTELDFLCIIEVKPDFAFSNIDRYLNCLRKSEFTKGFYFLLLEIKNDKLKCLVFSIHDDTLFKNEKGDIETGAMILQNCLNDWFKCSKFVKNKWAQAKMIIEHQC